MDYRKMWDMLGQAALAPARAYMAQSPQSPQGLLGDIHRAIDPVQAFGGYGGLLAMGLPPARFQFPAASGLGQEITIANRPTGLAEYVRRPGGRISYYDPKYATLTKDDFGTYVEPRPNVRSYPPGAQKRNDAIYRGMSAEEYENFLATGKIESNQSYNLGGQEGLTYFSNDPSSARTYASGFAPWEKSPTFSHPAYVVAVKRPPAERIKNVRGVGTDEVGVKGAIPKSDVLKVYKGQVYDFQPGWKHGGSRTTPSTRLTWSEVFDWLDTKRR